MSQHDSKLVDDDGDEDFQTLDQGGFEPYEDVGGAPEPLAEASDDVAATDEVEPEADEDEEESPKAKRRVVVLEKPKANVYTIMLIVSLVALTIGCLSLYGEMKQYDMDFRAKSAR
jgi:hypothetical protein